MNSEDHQILGTNLKIQNIAMANTMSININKY